MIKKCNTCKKTQPLTHFGVYRIRNTERRRHKCNKCRRIESQERYAKNPHIKEKMKATAYEHHLKKTYGLNKKDVDQMLLDQDNKCAICKKGFTKSPNIDHCHKTDKIRGLLCWNCNIGIGYLKDNPEILRNAITYLES